MWTTRIKVVFQPIMRLDLRVTWKDIHADPRMKRSI